MSRTYVGIDMTGAGLIISALQRGRPEPHLSGIHHECLDGVLEFSSQHPNVLDSGRFVEGLHSGVEKLAGGEQRLALSLPDRIGRIYVTEVEAPFKSHQEGADILKWHLKASLPAPPGEVRIDYQILERREGGRIRSVLDQYESLVNEAGLHAVRIGFHSLHLSNYYEKRVDLGDEFILVGLEENSLSLQYFLGKTLAYQRVRSVRFEPEVAFYELSRALAEACQLFPGMQRCSVYTHQDSGMQMATAEMLPALFDRETTPLDPHFSRFSGRVKTDQVQPSGSLAASLAAAESMM
jgi:type IV pilus assembly protein PilM